MKSCIAFVNQKGGTGKTTLSVNTAAWMATNKKVSVLLVDLDSQGHSGRSLGVDVDEVEFGSAEILSRQIRNFEDAIIDTRIPNLHLIAGNRRLVEVNQNLKPDKNGATKLARALSALERKYDFDVVIIDSPPSFGSLMLNGITAATDIVIPVALTYLALEGCADIVQTVEECNSRYGSKAVVSMVVPMFYRRTRMADEILAKLREHFGNKVAKTVVGYSVKIDEAQSFGQTIFEYAPNSNGAFMLESVAREVWNKAVRSKK